MNFIGDVSVRLQVWLDVLLQASPRGLDQQVYSCSAKTSQLVPLKDFQKSEPLAFQLFVDRTFHLASIVVHQELICWFRLDDTFSIKLGISILIFWLMLSLSTIWLFSSLFSLWFPKYFYAHFSSILASVCFHFRYSSIKIWSFALILEEDSSLIMA